MILVTSIEDKNLPFPASKQLQVTQQLPSPSLDKLAETAREYALNRSSANTQKAYASDWALFSRWCRRKGFDVLIPSAEVVGLYLAASASGAGLVKAVNRHAILTP